MNKKLKKEMEETRLKNSITRQEKDSELFTMLGCGGIILMVLIMWVMVFTMGC